MARQSQSSDWPQLEQSTKRRSAQKPGQEVAPAPHSEVVGLRAAVSHPGLASSATILALQRAVGNQAVLGLFGADAAAELHRLERSHREADPLAAELMRAAPTPLSRQRVQGQRARSSGLRQTIQRAKVEHPLGQVALPGEQKAPAFTAVTREGGHEFDEAGAEITKLKEAIGKARTWLPVAKGAAAATDAQVLAEVNKYFRLAGDPVFKTTLKTVNDRFGELNKLENDLKSDPSKQDAYDTAKADHAAAKKAHEDRRDTLVNGIKVKVPESLSKVEAGLAKDQSIVDVNPKDARKNPLMRGYVHPESRGWFVASPGDIHLKFSMLKTEPSEEVATVLVHEASHKYAGTVDIAYKHQKDKWKGMSHEQALQNADSYAKYVEAFHP